MILSSGGVPHPRTPPYVRPCALIKVQRGITKIVSVQDLAPYPRKVVQDSRVVLLQNIDELAIEAENSNPRISVPRLPLLENILNSSK